MFINGIVHFQVQLIFVYMIQFLFLDVHIKQYFGKYIILKEEIYLSNSQFECWMIRRILLVHNWVLIFFFLLAQQRLDVLNFMAFCKLIYTFSIGFKKRLEQAVFYSVISKDISILSSAIIFSCNFHNTVARH